MSQQAATLREPTAGESKCTPLLKKAHARSHAPTALKAQSGSPTASTVVSDFDHHARRYRHRHKLLEEKLACVRNVNLPHSARHTQCQSAASQDEARMASRDAPKRRVRRVAMRGRSQEVGRCRRSWARMFIGASGLRGRACEICEMFLQPRHSNDCFFMFAIAISPHRSHTCSEYSSEW